MFLRLFQKVEIRLHPQAPEFPGHLLSMSEEYHHGYVVSECRAIVGDAEVDRAIATRHHPARINAAVASP